MRFTRSAMASALLLTMLNVSIIGCPMSRDILPCTCKLDRGSHLKSVVCSGMNSYNQVHNALHGHFGLSDRISLKLIGSKIDDMAPRSFKDLNMTIENLQLNHDNLAKLDADVFEGLSGVTYLSLADNYLEEVPEHLWHALPNIKTLDLGRTRIRILKKSNFKGLRHLEALVVPGNLLMEMDRDSVPRTVSRFHIGRNYMTSLNGTVRNLDDLIWLFINANNLTDIEDELPPHAQKLKMIHASNNHIVKLPSTLTTLPSLETLFFHNNKIKSLDGCLGKSRKLQRLYLDNNIIDTLTEDDFKETESLVHLVLGYNKIKNLNNSLLGLRNLQFLNITTNYLEEFSFEEIVGLDKLSAIDLSFNRISSIKGPTTNLVEWNIKISDLKLDNNEIVALNGSLSGLRELIRLNLSNNKLQKISPDDFIGMEQLSMLDLSHNYLKTLEEMSKTFLPKLEVLKASDNYLTLLEKDFQGLPVLCHADLSNNQIIALGRDLVSKTRCKLGNGANEGSWDTLKIFLQENPILCDSALPEISSAMEINHTRIYGVSHCAPLSEQPVTNKPNGFLGYIPETTASSPAAISASVQMKAAAKSVSTVSSHIDTKLSRKHVDGNLTSNYSVINQHDSSIHSESKTEDDESHHMRHHKKPEPKPRTNNDDTFDNISDQKVSQTYNESIQLSKLASEVEQLKSRIAQIESNTLTEKPLNADLGENRKP